MRWRVFSGHHPAKTVPAILFVLGWLTYFPVIKCGVDPVHALMVPAGCLLVGCVLSYLIARHMR